MVNLFQIKGNMSRNPLKTVLICSFVFIGIVLAFNYNTATSNNNEKKIGNEVNSCPASNCPNVLPLKTSIENLRKIVASGKVFRTYEFILSKVFDLENDAYTKKAAWRSENVDKNRYSDIAPYDQTRFVIKGGHSGDYINANVVSMEIPGSRIVNRYIAGQGPLPTTCSDFWQMVWEAGSSLVVMLTTQFERGRVKCHKYWPAVGQEVKYGHIKVTGKDEVKTKTSVTRELTLRNTKSNEERHIRQMQYMAWPDHGVPDDPRDFLAFTQRVRASRDGNVEPTVVHCSAGIGRTGVYIGVDTALTWIEVGQPVDPADLVPQMRNQRPLMVQTPNQYKFLCETILTAYDEGLVRPS